MHTNNCTNFIYNELSQLRPLLVLKQYYDQTLCQGVFSIYNLLSQTRCRCLTWDINTIAKSAHNRHGVVKLAVGQNTHKQMVLDFNIACANVMNFKDSLRTPTQVNNPLAYLSSQLYFIQQHNLIALFLFLFLVLEGRDWEINLGRVETAAVAIRA